MKWKYKAKPAIKWELWFAFFPVKLGDPGPPEEGDTYVWLRFVYRKFYSSYYGANSYSYRLKKPLSREESKTGAEKRK